MEKLEYEVKSIFRKLILMMGSQQKMKLVKPGIKPLIMDTTHEMVQTPRGNGMLYRLMHLVKNGDSFCHCPEMQFVIIINDPITGAKDELFSVIPVYFKIPESNVDDIGIIFVNGTLVEENKPMCKQLCALATIWLKDLDFEGILDVKPEFLD